MRNTASGELALGVVADANALVSGGWRNLQADVEVAIADLAADGSAHSNRVLVTALVPAAKWEGETRKQGVTYQRQWKPSTDTSSLRVIVHDARSGHYGSLDVPFNKLPR